MAALELLCRLIGIDHKKFSKEENLVLEAGLFIKVCNELWKFFYLENKDYFQLFKFNAEMENMTMEINFIRYLISDILRSESYTLSGIAYYTQTSEEIIENLLINPQVNPIITFLRKLIELHKATRPEIYQKIIKNLTPDTD